MSRPLSSAAETARPRSGRSAQMPPSSPYESGVGGNAGFQSDNNIVFLSPIDGSEFGDLDYYEPVTEISDSELERLGFPVPTERSPDVGGGGFGAGSGRLGYPHGVIESPFIHFTSREYLT